MPDVGAMVGSGDGTVVGVAEGSIVGTKLGRNVGITLGLGDVGLAVGEGVGVIFM